MSIFSRQRRRPNGQYGRKKRVAWVVFVLLVAAHFTFGGHEMLMAWMDREMYAVNVSSLAPVAEASEDVASKTSQELRDEMVAKIWYGESRNYEPKPGEIWTIYDPPKRLAESGACQQRFEKLPWECFSYGPMQWKIETLQGFYKEVHGEEISEMRAIEIANDAEQAKQLAVDCWIKVEGCIWHWTSAHEHEEYFNTVLPIVRKLEQE